MNKRFAMRVSLLRKLHATLMKCHKQSMHDFNKDMLKKIWKKNP